MSNDFDFNLTDWINTDDCVAKSTESVPETPVLTKSEISILNFCEQTYWETGLLPTVEAVIQELPCSASTCRKAFQNPTFREQVAKRGMDPEQLVFPGKLIKQSKALSAQQIMVANRMLNLLDKRSEREKLSECQVSPQQYSAWLRNPTFVEFLSKRAEAMFQSSDHLAFKSLINSVKAGDNKAVELFMRMRGHYNPTINVQLNIESILMRVVEVISTHVKDPHVLQAIATEIDAIVEAEEVA